MNKNCCARNCFCWTLPVQPTSTFTPVPPAHISRWRLLPSRAVLFHSPWWHWPLPRSCSLKSEKRPPWFGELLFQLVGYLVVSHHGMALPHPGWKRSRGEMGGLTESCVCRRHYCCGRTPPRQCRSTPQTSPSVVWRLEEKALKLPRHSMEQGAFFVKGGWWKNTRAFSWCFSITMKVRGLLVFCDKTGNERCAAVSSNWKPLIHVQLVKLIVDGQVTYFSTRCCASWSWKAVSIHPSRGESGMNFTLHAKIQHPQWGGIVLHVLCKCLLAKSKNWNSLFSCENLLLWKC